MTLLSSTLRKAVTNQWRTLRTPRSTATAASEHFSTKTAAVTKSDDSSEKPLPAGATPDMEENIIQGLRNMEEMYAQSRVTVAPWTRSVGETDEMDAEGAYLPEKVEETAALDKAYDLSMEDIGKAKRVVQISQRSKGPMQSPMHKTKAWTISWHDEIVADNWDNPLMGWVSGADPMQNMRLQMEFDTAEQAIYFAKKRGWAYEVADEVTTDFSEDGEVEYQDNFLPKRIAKKLQRDATKCNWFERSSAGTSHYFRPLKYHGDGSVAQYGPNGEAKTSPDVEGQYKVR